MRYTNHMLASFALVGAFTSAAAADTFGPVANSDKVVTAVHAVCDAAKSGSIKLSKDALASCVTGTFPSLIADGSRFANRGIGAEFNALIAQQPVTTASK